MRLGRFDGMAVVLDVARLRGGVEPEVRRCCERLGARPIEWRSSGDEALPATGAVVSALRWGERVIPQALLDRLEVLPRREPLLLLSPEPLVAPSVTLHDGLVVLVQERNMGRLYGELRLALLRAATAAGGSRSGTPVDERCSEGLWCAGVETVLHQQGGSFSALLPLEERLEEPEMATLAGALRSICDPPTELASRLGTRAGFVSLDTDAGEWLIYWPSRAGSLWLCSPERLPQVVELRGVPKATHGDRRTLRLSAGRGDAILALARTTPPGLVPPSPAEGAQAWLDRALEAGAAGPGAGALAIEVRS